jgi:hypothetical protein
MGFQINTGMNLVDYPFNKDIVLIGEIRNLSEEFSNKYLTEF